MHKIDLHSLSKTRIDGIMRRIDTSGDCHLWTGQHHYGRGYVFIGGKEVTVARIMLALKRPISNRLHIKRTCNTPNCVNPDHLYQDNCYYGKPKKE